MAIDHEAVMQRKIENLRSSYTGKDTIRYALGVGMGRDPLDANELPFVVETKGLKVVPSMATVVG